MQDRTATDRDGRLTALARQEEILTLYDTMKRTLMTQILELEDGSDLPPKALVAKIGELSATHLVLLKAEDAFREKFCEDDDSVPDYDALRAEIGRKLDRIRDTGRAGEVPEKPD